MTDAMTDATTDDQPLQFGSFEVRPLQRLLMIDGRSASLGARAFDLLLAFAASPGRLLTKNELLDTVWPNVVVEENNLQVQISTLRKLLGPDVIATIPGHGYRFTARPLPAQAAASAPAPVFVSPATAPEASVSLALKTNLPSRLPALIGRDDDLVALDALLQARALVTVVGAGGIGKTLLAQHVLLRQRERHLHGVCFVELANLAAPEQVVGAVSAALGVQAGGGDNALDSLVQTVAPLTLLIALDNAEHLIDEVARVANALHAGAPGVTLLVTSQAPLQIGTEHVYRVGTLALPADGLALSAAAALGYGAIELFAERTRQVDRRFALDDGNVGTAVALCRRLDGLPLAIGLAAARVPLLGIEGLAAALGERLKLLTSGGRDASSRHRTLRAALEWSHGLLDEREQIMFRRLGVVVGSASLELVRHVAVDESLDEWSALDALSVLVERSLVALDPGPGGADHAAPRYRLLESPRAYAIERLADAGETEAIQARHGKAMAAHWARAFDRNHRGLIDLGDSRSALEPDLDNARAAFSWGLANDPVVAVTLTPVLNFMLEPDPQARHALCDAAEPLFVEPVPAQLRARALLECSRLMPLQSAVDWSRRALELYRTIDDEAGRYLALAQQAWSQGLSGNAEGAAAMVTEMESVFAAPPAIELAMRGEQAHAALAIAQNRWEDVLKHFRRHAEMWIEAGGSDRRGFGNVIEAEMVAGHIDEAVRDGEAMLNMLSGSRDVLRQMRTRIVLVAACLKRGDSARARTHAAQAWPQAALMALDAPLADHCALLAALESRPRTAARLVGYADAAYVAQHDVRQVAAEAHSVERALAAARAALGDAEVERQRAAGAALSVEAAAQAAMAERDSPG